MRGVKKGRERKTMKGRRSKKVRQPSLNWCLLLSIRSPTWDKLNPHRFQLLYCATAHLLVCTVNHRGYVCNTLLESVPLHAFWLLNSPLNPQCERPVGAVGRVRWSWRRAAAPAVGPRTGPCSNLPLLGPAGAFSHALVHARISPGSRSP